MSEQEREEKHSDYDSAEANLKSAEADVTLDQAHVNQYVALAQFKQVTAPYDGIVSQRDIDIGNLVTAGSTQLHDVALCHDTERPDASLRRRAAECRRRSHAGADPGRSQDRDGGPQRIPATSRAPRRRSTSRPARCGSRSTSPTPTAPGPGHVCESGFGFSRRAWYRFPPPRSIFPRQRPAGRPRRPSASSFRNVTIARDDGNAVELGSGVSNGDARALNSAARSATASWSR